MARQQPDEADRVESSPATLVLGSVHLLDLVLRHCAADQRQQVVRVLRGVCHDCRQACDELEHRPITQLVRDVRITSFRAAAASLRSWATRFLREATAARLALWCWDGRDQPHLHNTLLLNSIAVQAAHALSCLELRLPTLLATAVDRVLCLPSLQGLTRLNLSLDPWPEADETAAAERLMLNWVCGSAAALQRCIKYLAKLQHLELNLPSTERCPFDLGRLAPSLPPTLTSLAVAGHRGWRRASGFLGQEHCTAALADLAHLHRLQHLQLVNVLSAERDHALPPTLASLSYLEVAHGGRWPDSHLAGLLSTLGALPSLRCVHLQACQLGPDEQLSAQGLCSLSLKDCELPSSLRLSQLTALTRLGLHFRWNSPVPAGILCGLPALHSFDATCCDSLQRAITTLLPLPQLTALRLRAWHGDAVPLHLSGFTGLRDLQIDFYWYPEGLEQLVCLTRLSLRPPRAAPPLQLGQLEPLQQLAVLQPSSLAPPGWQPPGAANAAGGDADADASDASSESSWGSYPWSDTPLGVDSEDEQWEALTGLDAFYYI